MSAGCHERYQGVILTTAELGYSSNAYQPKLFMIPRYPTNLYFNVSTPAEWVAEYNCMYQAARARAW